jgi:hypothetical protein
MRVLTARPTGELYVQLVSLASQPSEVVSVVTTFYTAQSIGRGSDFLGVKGLPSSNWCFAWNIVLNKCGCESTTFPGCNTIHAEHLVIRGWSGSRTASFPCPKQPRPHHQPCLIRRLATIDFATLPSDHTSTKYLGHAHRGRVLRKMA